MQLSPPLYHKTDLAYLKIPQTNPIAMCSIAYVK
jgi:hypothetical protein